MSEQSYQESHVEAVKFTAPESGETAAPETVDTGVPGEQEPPKTFTQEDVDGAIQKRLGIERRKWEREQREIAEKAQPVPTEAPKPEQFRSQQEYLQALIDHGVSQGIAQREQQKQQREVVEVYRDRVAQVLDKYPDFEKVAHGDHIVITPESGAVIAASEIGPEIAYYLGSNPDEARRIAALPALRQAAEIGKIEAKLVDNPPAAKVSSAPNPIKPVGSRASTPNYSTSDPRWKGSDSEWIAQRNRELMKQARG